MENASRALLIAGSVLLGIIVLSLFMVMVNSLTDYQQSNVQNQREAEILRFNNQYDGYMRSDVSGTDILSLINKVIFYNRTKSYEGTEDEGAGIGYKPIKLIVDFETEEKRKLLTKSENNKLFTDNDNTLTFDNTSKGDTIANAITKIETIKNAKLPSLPSNDKEYYYSEGILQALSEYYANGKIFVDKTTFEGYSYEEKLKIFADFNTAIGKYYFPLTDLNEKSEYSKNALLNNWYSVLTNGESSDTGETIKEDLDYYYEYTQFKRAIFKWNPDSNENIYDTNTGRIIYMEFQFTGNFI